MVRLHAALSALEETTCVDSPGRADEMRASRRSLFGSIEILYPFPPSFGRIDTHPVRCKNRMTTHCVGWNYVSLLPFLPQFLSLRLIAKEILNIFSDTCLAWLYPDSIRSKLLMGHRMGWARPRIKMCAYASHWLEERGVDQI